MNLIAGILELYLFSSWLFSLRFLATNICFCHILILKFSNFSPVIWFLASFGSDWPFLLICEHLSLHFLMQYQFRNLAQVSLHPSSLNNCANEISYVCLNQKWWPSKFHWEFCEGSVSPYSICGLPYTCGRCSCKPICIPLKSPPRSCVWVICGSM
jgi:hypothetical protein